MRVERVEGDEIVEVDEESLTFLNSLNFLTPYLMVVLPSHN